MVTSLTSCFVSLVNLSLGWTGTGFKNTTSLSIFWEAFGRVFFLLNVCIFLKNVLAANCAFVFLLGAISFKSFIFLLLLWPIVAVSAISLMLNGIGDLSLIDFCISLQFFFQLFTRLKFYSMKAHSAQLYLYRWYNLLFLHLLDQFDFFCAFFFARSLYLLIICLAATCVREFF